VKRTAWSADKLAGMATSAAVQASSQEFSSGALLRPMVEGCLKTSPRAQPRDSDGPRDCEDEQGSLGSAKLACDTPDLGRSADNVASMPASAALQASELGRPSNKGCIESTAVHPAKAIFNESDSPKDCTQEKEDGTLQTPPVPMADQGSSYAEKTTVVRNLAEYKKFRLSKGDDGRGKLECWAQRNCQKGLQSARVGQCEIRIIVCAQALRHVNSVCLVCNRSTLRDVMRMLD
jgi:hypothetical protein